MSTRTTAAVTIGPAGVWGLATFHATVFVVILIMVLYKARGLSSGLQALNTALGLVLFGMLWLTTWWTTREVVRATRWIGRWSWSSTWRTSPCGHVAPLQWLGLGMLWGGVNGVLFVTGAGIVVVLALLPVGGGGLLLAVVAIHVLLPLAVAFVVGAVVGLVLAVVDLAVLKTAGWMIRTCTHPPGHADPAAAPDPQRTD
jgi:hypothetical protein